MDIATVQWPGSLWAAVTPPGPDLSELEGGLKKEVVFTTDDEEHRGTAAADSATHGFRCVFPQSN